MKRKILILCLSLCVPCLFAQTKGESGKENSSQPTAKFNPLSKVGMVAMYISRFYVDVLNENEIAEETIATMLKQLDPHSTYLPPKEARQTQENLSGKFDGIGIQLNMLNDTLYVVQTVVGGPSEKAGILPGDRIVSVDTAVVAGKHFDVSEIGSMLRGKRGSKVKVGISRRGVPDLIYFTVTRDKIPVYSIDATYMIDDTTGYIRLSRFAESSADEVEKAVKSLRKNGMKNLILDLQQNGGGYLNVAVKIADMFLDDDQLIVYTEGRNMRRAEERATSNTLFPDGRVVVLVDESSASASEIVAGALQDWDRGVVVGRRTFGKGLVQRPIPFPDNSLLRLTVARYHTPTGRCIQRPYVKGDVDDYEKDLMERLHSGELLYADSAHFVDSLQYRTLKNNRAVYGGGGIMPDCFVGIDTTLVTPYHQKLMRSGLINRCAYLYLDTHRKEIASKYRKSSKFIDEYQIDARLLDQLEKAAEEEGIVPADAVERNASLPLIAVQLKALLARDIYDAAVYYRIYNSANTIYLKGIDVIRSGEYDELLKSPTER